MTRALNRVGALLLALAMQWPACAQDREHPSLRRGVEEGELLSLPEVQRRLLPKMPGYRYLGPEFHSQAGIYRLKFIREGRVIWVDVNARSGRVVGRAEP